MFVKRMIVAHSFIVSSSYKIYLKIYEWLFPMKQGPLFFIKCSCQIDICLARSKHMSNSRKNVHYEAALVDEWLYSGGPYELIVLPFLFGVACYMG